MTRSIFRQVKSDSKRVERPPLGKLLLLSPKEKSDVTSDRPLNDLVVAISAIGPTPDF
jgi:hypothetical protein